MVAARWIPWVRTFTPVLAGTSRMPYRRFLSANVVGALAWAVGLTVLGHLAASQPALRHASYAVAALFVVGSLVGGCRRLVAPSGGAAGSSVASVGRHTVPGTGTPEPDRGFWVRLAVAAVVVLLAGSWYLLRGDGGGDEVGTAAGRTASPSAPAASSTPTPSGPSGSSGSVAPAPSASPPATTTAARPPTLAFTVRYPAYVTVRVPGGRTLVSKLFASGAKASFDQKVLEVVNGRPRAVRFVVNGKVRKQGPVGQTETFTVRRR